MRPRWFRWVEKVLKARTCEAGLECVRRVAEALTDEAEQRCGKVTERDVGVWGTGGVAETLTDEAGQDRGDERGDVGLDEQVLVFEECVCELHHHVEDEHVFESVGDLLGDELDKVG